MKENLERNISRRNVLRGAIAGAGVTAACTLLPEQAPARPVDIKQKRRPRYQANSPEVRNFYRVNSYPTR